MPLLSENLTVWNETYEWPQAGDEWPAAWGGVSYQWWTTLFPRLQGYVPARRILEIAPGYGRWTHFLKELCDELVIVDLAETAIAHCRKRFAADPHVIGHVNDGKSLAMIEENSIDLAFSFDSLVHAEQDVIYAYLAQLATKLTPDGIGFIHHSNMGAYRPSEYDGQNIHWRATSVSAATFEAIASSVGLHCVSQETLVWGDDDHSFLNDCVSVVTRVGSRWERENVVAENRRFSSHEIEMARTFSTLYPPSRRDIAFTTH